MSVETVWERLAPADPPADEVDPADGGAVGDHSSIEATTRKTFWRRVRLLDAVSACIWVYVVSKLLVDWDRALVSALAPGYEWLVNFRFLLLAVLLLGLGRLAKKLFPLWVVYIMLWPLILVTWRIPWLLLKRRKWNHVVGMAHIVTGALSGVKSALRGAVLLGGSLLFLLLPGAWSAWIAFMLAALFQAWLLVAAVRTGVRPSRFLAWQRGAVSNVKSTALAQDNQIASLRPVIEGSRSLTRIETDQFLQLVSNALLVNRFTYFWAYRINEYRKSPALIAYGSMAILTLLLGSLSSFTVMNLALHQEDSGNFDARGQPTAIKFVYYSLTSMYAGETELVAPVSDLALMVKIASTIIGAVLMMVLLVTLFLSYRYTRDEEDARRAVEEMRDAARRLENEFADEFQLTPEGALARMQELNHNLTGILLFFSRSVPDDFLSR